MEYRLRKCFLRKFDREYGIEAFILKYSSLEGLDLSQFSHFYRQCLTLWSENLVNEKIYTKGQILSQDIMGNGNVLFKKKISAF